MKQLTHRQYDALEGAITHGRRVIGFSARDRVRRHSEASVYGRLARSRSIRASDHRRGDHALPRRDRPLEVVG